MKVICSVCGETKNEEETISLEGKTVCAACKPLFIQRLQTGYTPETQAIDLPDSPLGFLPIVAIAWRILRERWLAIAGLTLLTAIPSNLLLNGFGSTEPSLREIAQQMRFAGLLEALVGVLSSLAVIYLVKERMEGRQVRAGEALRHGVSRWASGIGTFLLGNLIISLLLLLLVVPGLIWLCYYTFSICVVSLRGRGGKRALDYSKALVQGRWWRVALCALGFFGIGLVPVIALNAASSSIAESTALTVTVDCLTDILMAFGAVCLTVLFLNLEKIEAKNPLSATNRQHL